MTDAEKYAKVFRAAADGLVDTAVRAEAMQRGCNDQKLEQAWYDATMKYEWTRYCALKDTNLLPQWSAYNGVAVVFEKIAETEKV